MASVFLSYDHEDERFAASVASALEKVGHSVWWDRHIHGGAEYNSEIETAVEAADAVVVLWSERSVRSAWVRDEAAEGRDRGKLVPVALDSTRPPMGFRQYQTIDLSQMRALRGKPLQQLLKTIDALADNKAIAPATRREGKPSSALGLPIARRTAVAIVSVLSLLLTGFGAWSLLGRSNLPVVAVAPADSAPRSQALSRDLYVKLGTLAHVGESKWRLADSEAAPSRPDLVFRTAATGSPAQPQASLILLDGKRNSVLWSREFTYGAEADQRQQVSLTAGRVLDCALQSREAGGMPAHLLKQFLAACAEGSEISHMDVDKIAAVMRTIVEQQPRFTPAWEGLLSAGMHAVALAEVANSGQAEARKTLMQDMAKAREIAPDLRAIKLAEISFLSPFDYAGKLERLAQADADETQALLSVGRMADAIASAKNSAERDPLSTSATTQLIMTLAYAGRIDLAKEELQKAERLWAGTAALEDAQWAFHQRYGDPRIAQAMARAPADLAPYFRARMAPTPENVNAVVEEVRRYRSDAEVSDMFGYAIQALAEFDKIDETFEWLARTPPSRLASHSYVLFRPAFAEVRRDPRFMHVAKRIGLLSYWQRSGKWPDFCFEPRLPYDCKKEAARLLG